MTHQILLAFEVTDEQAAILNSPGGVALVIPMIGSEVVPFGVKLNALADAFAFFKRALSTLQQALESGGDRDGRIGKTLAQMHPPVSDANIILDDIRVIIGTAQFVQTGDGKERLQ